MPNNILSFLGNLPGQSIADSNASGNHGIISDQAGSYADINDADLQSRLQALRQFDPNASINTKVNDSGQTMYGISFDQDKLPKAQRSADGSQMALHPDDFANQFQSQMASGGGTDAIRHTVIDPSKVITNSPYGQMTDSSNVTTQHIKTPLGMLDKIGPMLPFAAAAAFPAMFSGLTAAGGAGGLGMSNLASSAIKTGAGILNNAASGNPFNPLSLAGVAGNALGVPSWITQLAQQYPQLAAMLKNRG